MSIIQLQGEEELRQGIYYEFDDSSRPLGEGGMGKVFRGRRKNMHTREVRDVAIKFIYAGLPPNTIQRAKDEASIQIHNDNLVEMMGFLSIESTAPNGARTVRYHVVSELLLGVSLADLLKGKCLDQNGERVAYAEELHQLSTTDRNAFAYEIMRKVLSGILALHDACYIHRDIDPSNIMITHDRKIKIIDFGIAKKIDGLHTDDRNLTVDGQFLGKPQYAAPELILGELKNQNKPTDIYALGILFFQLLTGNLPFEGPSNIVLNAHLRREIPLKPIKNSPYRKTIERATEKDCTKRYQTVAEFRADLDSISMGKVESKFEKYRNLIFGIIAAAVIVAGLIIFISKIRPSEHLVDQNENEQPANTVYDRLAIPDKAFDAFVELQKMAAAGDLEAKYVESRIYAQSNKIYSVPEHIMTFQANLSNKVRQDIATSHRLLKEVVKANPNDYRALYDLACDHYHYNNEYGITRDLAQAQQLLIKAKKLAEEKNDYIYIKKIDAMLDNY